MILVKNFKFLYLFDLGTFGLEKKMVKFYIEN